ncbi:hypothetical protein LINPERPRIM_LOCUS34825 [Linum perenne]
MNFHLLTNLPIVFSDEAFTAGDLPSSPPLNPTILEPPPLIFYLSCRPSSNRFNTPSSPSFLKSPPPPLMSRPPPLVSMPNISDRFQQLTGAATIRLVLRASPKRGSCFLSPSLDFCSSRDSRHSLHFPVPKLQPPTPFSSPLPHERKPFSPFLSLGIERALSPIPSLPLYLNETATRPWVQWFGWLGWVYSVQPPNLRSRLDG